MLHVELIRSMRPALPHLSSMSRKVGAAHLVLAAAVNTAFGVGLFVVAGRGDAYDAVLWSLDRFVEPGVVLAWGPDAIRTFVLALRVVGVVLVAVAVFQLVAARFVFVGRRRAVGIVAGVAGMVTVVSLPWALVSTVLVYLTADQFDTAVGVTDTER